MDKGIEEWMGGQMDGQKGGWLGEGVCPSSVLHFLQMTSPSQTHYPFPFAFPKLTLKTGPAFFSPAGRSVHVIHKFLRFSSPTREEGFFHYEKPLFTLLLRP